MVQYVVVRYTKEYVCIEDNEKLAKSTAIIMANYDNDENAWYEIEPYAVL